MSSTLIYADDASYVPGLVSAAKALGDSSPLVLAPTEVVASASSEYANAIYPSGEIADYDAHVVGELIADVAADRSTDVIILESDKFGKEIAGHAAQIMGAAACTDVTAARVDGESRIVRRGSLNGALVEEDRALAETCIFAFAPKSYPVAESFAGSCEEVEVEIADPRIKLVGACEKEETRKDIASSDIVLAVGCGVESQEGLAAIEELAEKLDAAVGCTKPISTDRKWLPEECTIGISGKTCKPSLAITFGASGQVQFWAGIRDAGTVVSVNTDENAGIVALSDASVIMDAVEAAKEIASKIE